MKIIYVVLILLLSKTVASQKIHPLEKFDFDSSYKLVAISSARSESQPPIDLYNFCVTDLKEMMQLKKNWVLKKRHGNIQMEFNSISIVVVKGKDRIGQPLLIFPRQQIANFNDVWYDFNLDDFQRLQDAFPLRARSQFFEFATYAEYTFFEDSIQSDLKYLFLYKPGAKEFEGQFDVIVDISKGEDAAVFAYKEIEKQISNSFPNERFHLNHDINDPFNVENSTRVKFRVECSKGLFEKYSVKGVVKLAWKEAMYSTRVVFRE